MFLAAYASIETHPLVPVIIATILAATFCDVSLMQVTSPHLQSSAPGIRSSQGQF